MDSNFSVTHAEYIEKNKSLADLNVFSGKALLTWQKHVCWSTLITHYAPTKWIDYGCGPAYSYMPVKGRQMYELAKQTQSHFILYDPCHERFANFPNVESVPGIMCVDVIEHIPETDVYATLDYLFSVCSQWMYLFISTKRSARPFEDMSDNTHCTLKTRNEWIDIVNRYARAHPHIAVILGTDYVDDTFDHNGKSYTYNQWNVPSAVTQQIKHKREQFLQSSPQLASIEPWHLTDSDFSV